MVIVLGIQRLISFNPRSPVKIHTRVLILSRILASIERGLILHYKIPSIDNEPMKLQTTTNILVVISLVVNTFVLSKIGEQFRVANEKIERADKMMAKALEITASADEVISGIKNGEIKIDDATEKKLKKKARESIRGLLEDL